jgi:ABC-type branched-subunit amino acid transport system ATPase component
MKRLLGVTGAVQDHGVGLLLIEQFTDPTLGKPDTTIVLRGGQTCYNGTASRLAED